MKREDEITAKIIALLVIYGKDENLRQPFVERLTFRPNEVEAVLKAVKEPSFREWIQTIAPMTKQ
ncbi:MAG: hypothetical protein LBQ60_03760 [Bacteroidales bacterium]|jgi:hypothetical protein|nr:hypothetical protein [Bacteroidales bacterium]